MADRYWVPAMEFAKIWGRIQVDLRPQAGRRGCILVSIQCNIARLVQCLHCLELTPFAHVTCMASIKLHYILLTSAELIHPLTTLDETADLHPYRPPAYSLL